MMRTNYRLNKSSLEEALRVSEAGYEEFQLETDPNLKDLGTHDRLLDILRNARFNSAKQVIETLTEEVNRHRNGAEPNDDLTMFCLRVS